MAETPKSDGSTDQIRTADATRSPTGLIARGSGAGAALAGCGALLYLLVFAWHAIATDLTAHGNPAGPIGKHGNPVTGIAVVAWLGMLVGGLPAVLAGTFGGALVGTVLTLTWRIQGPVRTWLTGTVLLYPVAVIINYVALTLRETRLQFHDYLMFLGLPSLAYVLAAGPLAVWLYRRGKALAAEQIRSG